MLRSTSVSQACGSTPLIFAVSISEAMIPQFSPPASWPANSQFFRPERVPVHSAHVGQSYRVHYRWHAYFGSEVKVYRTFRRSDGQIVGLERDEGVTVLAPYWVLDAAVCQAMKLGSPMLAIDALREVHELLCALGFRRDFVDEASPMETAHDGSKADSTGTTASAISTGDERRAHGAGAAPRCDGPGATAALSGHELSGRGKR